MLRILTKKSTMGFGMFPDFKVSEVMEIFNKKQYIIWCYFNLSNISFHEDILAELNIPYRIDKPGKDERLFGEFMKQYTKGYDWKDLDVIEASKKKIRCKRIKRRRYVQEAKLSTHSRADNAYLNRKRNP